MEQVILRYTDWAKDAVYYSIYPLGMLGAPEANDFSSKPVNRLQQIIKWIPHLKVLGCNALYLGPVFESDFHGYDTKDYLMVDRRLGDEQALKDLSFELHQQHIKLVLDGVFNHVGRNFFAFKDLQENGQKSVYRDRFCGVDFSRQSSYGDAFYYDGWYDAYNLVKLNVKHPDVCSYLLHAVSTWIDNYQIDGLRLDVAEIIDKKFLGAVADFCHNLDPDFWLMGEVINGNYRNWANPGLLNSTTNYEAYKAIYSGHNDQNYHEIAGMLNRQYGENGIYRDLMLYNFVDNHDATRISSILHKPEHVFLAYALLFTMPGIPSVYYGSEWAIPGIKGLHDDIALRPAVRFPPDLSHSAIFIFIQKLISIRQSDTALRYGGYRELYVSNDQLVFERRDANQLAIIALNLADGPAIIEFATTYSSAIFEDALDPASRFLVIDGKLIIPLPANGSRILQKKTHDL